MFSALSFFKETSSAESDELILFKNAVDRQYPNYQAPSPQTYRQWHTIIKQWLPKLSAGECPFHPIVLGEINTHKDQVTWNKILFWTIRQHKAELSACKNEHQALPHLARYFSQWTQLHTGCANIVRQDTLVAHLTNFIFKEHNADMQSQRQWLRAFCQTGLHAKGFNSIALAVYQYAALREQDHHAITQLCHIEPIEMLHDQAQKLVQIARSIMIADSKDLLEALYQSRRTEYEAVVAQKKAELEKLAQIHSEELLGIEKTKKISKKTSRISS